MATGSSQMAVDAASSGLSADSANKILMTATGFKEIDGELRHLKSVVRPGIIQAIAEARSHGDLSENAEYHAAREQQSMTEGRIKKLSAIIGRAEVVDVSKLSGPIKFGATVTIENDETGKQVTYQIVSEAEADIENGLINLHSPLARAMIGKDADDYFEVRVPGGVRSYTILQVEYI